MGQTGKAITQHNPPVITLTLIHFGNTLFHQTFPNVSILWKQYPIQYWKQFQTELDTVLIQIMETVFIGIENSIQIMKTVSI